MAGKIYNLNLVFVNGEQCGEIYRKYGGWTWRRRSGATECFRRSLKKEAVLYHIASLFRVNEDAVTTQKPQ